MIGLHMHIGSQITTTEPYARAVAKGVEMIGRLREWVIGLGGTTWGVVTASPTRDAKHGPSANSPR